MPSPILDIVDIAGDPVMKITQKCSDCGAVVTEHSFDSGKVSDPSRFGELMGAGDAMEWIKHVRSVHDPVEAQVLGKHAGNA